MRRILIVLLCIGMASTGCRKKETVIPPGILSPSAMADLLADIHVVQAAVSIRSASDTSFVPFASYAPAVFRNHGISAAGYDSSLNFYTQHPELLDSVYKDVIDELSRRQVEEAGRQR